MCTISWGTFYGDLGSLSRCRDDRSCLTMQTILKLQHKNCLHVISVRKKKFFARKALCGRVQSKSEAMFTCRLECSFVNSFLNARFEFCHAEKLVWSAFLTAILAQFDVRKTLKSKGEKQSLDKIYFFLAEKSLVWNFSQFFPFVSERLSEKFQCQIEAFGVSERNEMIS